MIVRVFRYQLRDGTESTFEGLVRTQGLPRFRAAPGLRFAWAARRRDGVPGGAVVSGWETFDALLAAVGGDIGRPALLPPEATALITGADITHWEALDVEPVPATDASILRIALGTVESASDAAYYAYLRDEVWPRLGAVAGLAGAWFGRQVDGGAVEPIVSLSLWRSLADLEAVGGTTGEVFRRDGVAILRLDAIELFDVFARTDGPAAEG